MNKRAKLLPVVVLLFFIVFSVQAVAQMGMHGSGGGWGMGSPYGRMYDPKTVQTISGEVERIDTFTPMQGMSGGLHLTVKTDAGTVSVHLGPSWYIENQDVKIQPRDRIEITGSRITFQGKPAIIAREVRKGDEVLQLRDDSGYPVWSGWRRR